MNKFNIGKPKGYILSLFILLTFNFLNAQNALDFDGIDDRVDCGNDPSVQITGTAITLEAWIYPTAWKPNVWEGCIINKEQNNPDAGYMLRAGNNGRLNFNIGNGSWHELTSGPNVLALNAWQHVAGTYDGSVMKIYVDGNVVDSMSRSISISNSSQNLIIGDYTGMNREFSGTIDEVRIWDVARTQAQIVADINTEYCWLTPSGLVAYYKFDNGIAGGNNVGNGILIDHSAFGNSGTLSNFALTGANSNWVMGAAIANGVVDTTVTQNGAVLTSNSSTAFHRWLNCDSAYAFIPGGTNQAFTATMSGNYAVEVDENGCVDTSDCINVIIVGIEEEQIQNQLTIAPNPFEHSFSVRFGGIQQVEELLVHDVKGQLVYSERDLSRQTIEVAFEAPAGIYFLTINTANKQYYHKLIKE